MAVAGAALMALTGAGAAQAGILYFSEDGNSNGLYTLNTNNGAATNIGTSGVTGQTVGLASSADPTVLFGSQFSNILKIKAQTKGEIWPTKPQLKLKIKSDRAEVIVRSPLS